MEYPDVVTNLDGFVESKELDCLDESIEGGIDCLQKVGQGRVDCCSVQVVMPKEM